MTDKQKIEKLAKGMGWHKASEPYGRGPYWSDNEFDDWVANMDWNPWTSWHDAGMVWDELRQSHKLCCMELYSDYDYGWWFRWSYADERDQHEKHTTPHCDSGPAAIAEAALKVFDGL